LQAIVSIGALSLIVLPWIRRWAYEICIKFHFAFGVCAVVTIWLHLKHRYQIDGLLVIASVGVLVTTTILHFVRLLFRNIKSGRSFPIADIEKLEGAIKLTFNPPRPWKVKAGEFIYVRIPGVRLLSFAESHPYNIAWWEQDESDEKASSISILAKIESGMTRDLFASSSKSFRVLVDGPYGKCLDTDRCDSIVFIATDIGITAQLPYVKELVQRQSGHYRKKRISLIWELEQEGESNKSHLSTSS
jgi:predicted ferric reductase